VGGVGRGPGDTGSILPGLVVRPVDVAVSGNSSQGLVAIASARECRHAVQLFEPDFTFRSSLASLGESGRPFGGVCRIAIDGELLWIAES